MKRSRSLTEKLRESLPLSFKLELKRILAGLDIRREWSGGQSARRAPSAQELSAREHFGDHPSLTEPASDGRRGPTVLVFDDHLPMPDRDAGSARMVFILKALASWSRPVFISLGKGHPPDYERALWQAGIEIADAVDYVRLLKNRSVFAVILSRPKVAEALLPAIRRRAPHVKIVFDTVDVHFVRLEREHALTGAPETAEEARRYRKLETRLARASDLVWCASGEDKKALEREAPAARIEVVPTIHRLHERGKSFDERAHLLFVGNFHHRPNRDAVLFFMKEIYPLVEQIVPGAEFHIVGDNAPEEIKSYRSAKVRVLGYVPNIAPLYESCRAFVAPLRFGAGMKGKIGDSLSYGLPVVTTSVGAEGIGLRDGEEALIADDPREFADAIVRVYRERELWERLADGGYHHVEKHFTPQVVGEIVNDSIRELEAAGIDKSPVGTN